MNEESRFQIWLDQKRLKKDDKSLFDFFITFIDYFNSAKEKKLDNSTVICNNLECDGYSKDIISFEFGCFLLHRADFWLYIKKK